MIRSLVVFDRSMRCLQRVLMGLVMDNIVLRFNKHDYRASIAREYV